MSCKDEAENEGSALQGPTRTALAQVDGAPRCVVESCRQPLDQDGECPVGHAQERPPRSAQGILEAGDLAGQTFSDVALRDTALAMAGEFAQVWAARLEAGYPLALLAEEADATAVALRAWNDALQERLADEYKRVRTSGATMRDLLPPCARENDTPLGEALDWVASRITSTWLNRDVPIDTVPARVEQDTAELARLLLAWKRGVLAASGLSAERITELEARSRERQAEWGYAPTALAILEPAVPAPRPVDRPDLAILEPGVSILAQLAAVAQRVDEDAAAADGSRVRRLGEQAIEIRLRMKALAQTLAGVLGTCYQRGDLRDTDLLRLAEEQPPATTSGPRQGAAPDDEFGALRAAVHSGQGALQQGALTVLRGAEGPEAQQLLRFLAAVPDDGVRGHAYRELWKRGGAADPALLAQALRDTPTIKRAALEAAVRDNPVQATEHVLAAMDDPNTSVRQTAAYLLGKLGTPPAGARLQAAALHDDDPVIRVQAIRVLQRMGAAGVPYLLQTWQESGSGPLDEEVRGNIVYRLSQIKGAGPDQALLTMLQAERPTNTWDDRLNIAEQLLRRGVTAPEMVPVLSAALSATGPEPLTVKARYVRAIQMLGTVGRFQSGVGPTLRQAMGSKDNDLREEARRAMGLTGQAEFVPDLVAQVRQHDSYTALQALGQLPAEPVAAALGPLVVDEAFDPGLMRERAIVTLASTGAAGLPALLQHLRSRRFHDLPEMGDCRAVLRALGAHGGQEALDLLVDMRDHYASRGSAFHEEIIRTVELLQQRLAS